MKKLLACFTVVLMMLMLAACGDSGSSSSSAPAPSSPSSSASSAVEEPSLPETGKLVIYTPMADDFLNPLLDAFAAEYPDIDVEIITAGTGELLTRIESEANSPMGDLLLSGTISSVQYKSYLFADYVSPNDAFIRDGMKNVEGMMTRFNESPSVFIVNTDLADDIRIEGYADLLNPELKGKIATADPAASSSAWGQLLNMLYAMGEGDPEAGWDYVEQFVANLDGKFVQSSSGVYKGVADGEYVVGLTYEEPVVNYLLADAPVRIVYMEEGVIFRGDGVYIIKDAPNMLSAQHFVDFVTSKETQTMINEDLNRRSVRTDVPTSPYLKATSDIKVIVDDEEYVEANKEAWLDKFKDIVVNG